MPTLTNLTIEWSGTVTSHSQSETGAGREHSFQALSRSPFDATDRSAFHIKLRPGEVVPSGAVVVFVGPALCPARDGSTVVTAEQAYHLPASLAPLAHETLNVITVIGTGEVIRRQPNRPGTGTAGWWCLWVYHNIYSSESGEVLKFGVIYADGEGIISGLAPEIMREGTIVALRGTLVKYAEQDRVWIVRRASRSRQGSSSVVVVLREVLSASYTVVSGVDLLLMTVNAQAKDCIAIQCMFNEGIGSHKEMNCRHTRAQHGQKAQGSSRYIVTGIDTRTV
ncbi:uncharacterized protein MELLADRAFT_91065 [Melampsora larici-populina 98AG31]|uniref:Uncharacterized protein n=1 Tax=Melampsora larici-populina (strain 98AG31 / pathotype 3-4-7) TaxID=747676 RepID=F4R8J7_MELLP|nr:uncharacterized protein MELLADRAFT_91065 [Melampsora larici-populina 98AG31]EGG11492.1 hypothetical protein MELLADRAFT_91065 [Melampsora larici-populina 98AG31]